MSTRVEQLDEMQPSMLPPKKDALMGAAFLLFVILGLSALIYSTVNWMTDAQRMPLSRLMVEGDLEHISPEKVQHALASLPSIGTFMTQDIGELQKTLEKLPWVAQVSIRKQWPDLIKVYIVEYKESAIWNGTSLLNQAGDIFYAYPEDASDNVVNLYGPQGSNKEVLSVWRESSKKLAPLGLTITSLVLNERLAWQIILDNGIRLELGKSARVSRLDRFVGLYQRLGPKAEQISYIDLRYDTGAAIGWISDNDLRQESNNK